MLKSFSIIFYKGDSLISKLIKKISNSSTYSHCAIILDELHCLESSWRHPCVIKHFNYKQGDYDIYELTFDLTDGQKNKLIKYITDNLNSGYDYLYLFTRGLNYLFNSPIYNSKSTLTCDELVYEAFKSIGIELVDYEVKLNPEALSKSKLLQIKS